MSLLGLITPPAQMTHRMSASLNRAPTRPTGLARLHLARRAHWVTSTLTRPRRGVAVAIRLARPRVDCLQRWPCEGPHETRSARGAARPRRATGCSARVYEPERLSMSDPRGLAAGQVLLQLGGGCP